MGFTKEESLLPIKVARFIRILKRVSEAEIAISPISQLLASGFEKPEPYVSNLLILINKALAESPRPLEEWSRTEKTLGADLLAKLVGISKVSLGRYKSKERETPVGTATRLHFLAMLIADLSGSYNEYGVRRWFERKRYQLDGKAPVRLLGKNWAPDDDGAKKIKNLARVLSGAPAT